MKAKELQRRADELVPTGSAWEWNQIMMDFGARLCVARSPRCGECPVRAECRWAGDPAVDDPAPASAGASKPQARFEGSDRQARGRAMRALTDGGRTREELVAAMSLTTDVPRAMSLIDALVREGLVTEESALLRLP
jgi:A/G-specific adenine glycosylase